MKLDKLSKTLLKHLNTYNNAAAYVHQFFEEDLLPIANACYVSTDDIRLAVEYLTSKGYLEYVKYSNGSIGGFRLTHKGIHYKEIELNEFTSNLFKSVLIPILVAILTAIALDGYEFFSINNWLSKNITKVELLETTPDVR